MGRITKREIQFYRSLHDKKGRYMNKCFLIEGFHLVEEALFSGFPLHEVLFTNKQQINRTQSFIHKLSKRNIPFRIINHRDFTQIAATESPQPIIALAPLPDMSHDIIGSAIYLYQVSDPGNLGTIMRTALWYDVSHVILSYDSCDPFNPKAVRASQGAVFRIKLSVNMELLRLKSHVTTHQILISDPETHSFPKVNNNFIGVFGSESHGLSGVTMDFPYQRFGIARKGYGESLNLAVSVGIFLDRITSR